MFRPSFAVQARELTQLQTILQEQINKIGSHIFEQGSMVIPGDMNIDMFYDYVQLESTFNAQTVETYRTEFQDKILESTTTGLKARVITTVAATDTDPLTLYIKYENTGTDGVTQTFLRQGKQSPLLMQIILLPQTSNLQQIKLPSALHRLVLILLQ